MWSRVPVAMDFFLGVLAIISLTIAALFLIGASLPHRHSTRLRATIRRPTETVWALLVNYERHPMGGKFVRTLEARSSENGLPSWMEDLGETRILVRTVKQDPPYWLVRELVDQVLPMVARVEFLLEESGEGCVIQVNHETHIPSGPWHAPIFRLLVKLQNSPETNLKVFLTHLAGELGTKPTWEESNHG